MIKKHDAAVADILRCYEIGMTKVSDVCSYAAVSREWYYKELRKGDFEKRVETAKMKRKAHALGVIMKAAQTTWTAAAWFLERTYSDDFALKQRLEHSGIEAAAPITVNVIPADYPQLPAATPQIESAHADDQRKGH